MHKKSCFLLRLFVPPCGQIGLSTLGCVFSAVSSPPTEPSSASSIDHARWFADEVHAHDSSLKAYVRSSFPHLRDVDDVVQESYLRIWRVRASHTIHSAKGFLFTLARHVALDLVRRNRVSPVDAVADLAQLPALENSPDAAEFADQQEKIRLLGKALALLPDRCREVVVLRKFQGLSQRDVAERLGISEAAVEHHVARGLKKCEAYLRSLGIESIYHEKR
jgi:RNA polymerase sigma factor (sigma-70 family)